MHSIFNTKKRKRFQLTRSVGSVTNSLTTVGTNQTISTHTLRGERDNVIRRKIDVENTISTHTLRGERDRLKFYHSLTLIISTHTLRGERDKNFPNSFINSFMSFQLTRSVGSVTFLHCRT